MTKSELIDALYEEFGRTIERRKIRAAAEAVFDTITGRLARGNRVEFRGFGSFHVKSIGERTGRNPRTGEAVEIPERHRPWFRTSRKLDNRLNAEEQS